MPDNHDALNLGAQALGEGRFEDVPVVRFKMNHDFTTFRAEHGVDGSDLVFHFYPSPEYPRWPKGFAQALEKVAMAYFNAEQPTLQASYTAEMDSWWLRARGFADVGEPDYRAQRMYELLDEELEKQLRG